jgi:hypothetical protein
MVAYSSLTHGSAVQRFNARLAAGGTEFRFPTEEPKLRDHQSSVWFEHFVAEKDGEIFGGYLIKHQRFLMDNVAVGLDNLQLPLSLGLVDNRFSHVSAALLFDALGRNDLLYCLGLGSQDSKLVKLLTAAGWQHQVVPFYFRIRSANRFALNIRLPANRVWTQRALRGAGRLRLAGAALWAVNAGRGIKAAPEPQPELAIEEIGHFDQFADVLFQEHAGDYSLVGDRRAETLNWWYPPSNPGFLRLAVKVAGRVVGWAVLLDTHMVGHNYFGNLRVGTLADGFARPGHAATVVAAADRFLSARGVDLVVSNQLHPEWGVALTQVGYRQGPSNFFFYFSRDLADRLTGMPNWHRRLHINRGDGDGPIHL